MQAPPDRAQLIEELKQVAHYTVWRPADIAHLGLLRFEVIVEEAAGAEEAAERVRALQRVLASIIDGVIATMPQRDDEPHLRVRVAELLFYPEGRHKKKGIGDRRRHIKQHIARGRNYDQRTYEARLIGDVADELYELERATRAGLAMPVAIDVNAGLRLDSDPHYVQTLTVAPGDVVEVSGVLRLADPPTSPDRALEVRVSIAVAAPASDVHCDLQARALNARHLAGYTPFDAVTLSSGSDQRIAVVNPRSFFIQFSRYDTTSDLAWDTGRRIPDNWLQLWACEDKAWTACLRVTVDRTLTADLSDTLKVSFLADVHSS